MHLSCLEFVLQNISRSDVAGKRVLEVGSQYVNGSARDVFKLLDPAEYIGVDIAEAPGVDIVCGAENLVDKFGENSFDVVVSTEMLEHVPDWRLVCSNLKRVVKAGGILILTTRSKGMLYHAYPWDFWRYSIDDVKDIFSDVDITVLREDTDFPGVLLRANKPIDFREKHSEIDLYNIVLNRRAKVSELDGPEFNQKLKSLSRRINIREWRRGLRKSIKGFFIGKA